jgi:hypothetical protein
MQRMHTVFGRFLLILWVSSPVLQWLHLAEHHLHHSGDEGCAHHHSHQASSPVDEGAAAFHMSDDCDLCDWQWLPSEKDLGRSWKGAMVDVNVALAMGESRSAWGSATLEGDALRRGPPGGFNLV